MQQKEILALTGLRGVAAIWVLALHIRNMSDHVYPAAKEPLSWIANAGYLGVDIFFALSGFVLAYSYSSISRNEYLPFIWKRLARIYPVHLATLALMALSAAALGSAYATPGLLTTDGLFTSLTLTHAWAYPVKATWNVPSWSISSEFAAYLLFPLIVAASHRIRSPRVCVLAIASLYFVLLLVTSQHVHADSMAYGIPRIAAGFTAGLLLHRLFTLKGAVKSAFVVALCVACFAAASALDLISGIELSMDYFPILSCALIYSLLSPGKLTTALSTPTMIYLGRVSFALYMVHGVIIRIARSLVPVKITDPVAGWLLLVAVAAVSFVAAVLLYRYVEIPSRAVMLRMMESRRARPVSDIPS